MNENLPESVKNRAEENANVTNSGIKIAGKMPPAMLKAMEEVQAKKGNSIPQQNMTTQEQNIKQQKPKQQNFQNDSSVEEAKPKFFKDQWNTYARPQGSEKLEELISTLREHNNNYDKLELPSKGKFYNGEDGPVDGFVYLREMTGAEEQILATPRYVQKGHAIDMIFQKCLKMPFRTERLLSADRTFMLIWLRAASYSPDYEVEIKCPDTNKKFTHKINLFEDIQINYCPNDFNQDSLIDVLPISKFNFSYRLSRGMDETAVQNYIEKHGKKNVNDADETLTFRTALLINEIEELSNKQEIMTLIKKLPVQDVAYLRTIMSEPPFGVDTKITVLSPYTMNEFEIELPFDSSFFFPRSKLRKGENLTQNSPEI